jgi:PAS domain S-box-containing protein
MATTTLAHSESPPLLRRVINKLPEGRALPEDVWQGRHLGIIILLWLHVAGLIGFAMIMGNSLEHSLLEGALVAGPAVVASITPLGRRIRSALASLGLISASGVLVHLSGGFIEMHFHFFVMVVVISLYQDWVPFLLTIGYVVVHHGVLGLIYPEAVFNHPAAQEEPWKWAIIHAVFVLGASVASMVNWRLNEQARAQQELLLTSAGEGIGGIDRAGKITFVNPIAATLLGWQMDEVIGQPARTLFFPEDLGETQSEGAREALERALRHGQAQPRSMATFRHRNGSTFPVEYVCMPMQQRGQVIGAVLTFQNISERKRVEAELQAARETAESASRAKSEFLSRMSHELRTPLNAILNFTHFMGDVEISAGLLNEQQRGFQHRVLHNAEHLLGLINDVLDISKIEAGKAELNRSACDLGPLFEIVLATTTSLIQEKGLALELEAPVELPLVLIDETRVRQVLLNLLSNAAKFTEQGGINVRARVDGADFVEITVADTGVGISLDEQELVFQEFYQVPSWKPDVLPGTGLGLSISKRMVELHGGHMWLESTLGQGSTFRFTLPIAPLV